MGCIVGQFVAIRMIVLKEDGEGPEAFEKWMTNRTSPGKPSFIDAMGAAFQDKGLLRITFLRGNKEKANFPSEEPYPLQSDVTANPAVTSLGRPKRKESTAAGANADYAWITYWKSKKDNQNAWKAERSDEWYEIWSAFKAKCYPKADGRPVHGPPYDFLGSALSDPTHYGHGAGCLVEGFEVIWEWSPAASTEQQPRA
jgi:hypothetical protein